MILMIGKSNGKWKALSGTKMQERQETNFRIGWGKKRGGKRWDVANDRGIQAKR